MATPDDTSEKILQALDEQEQERLRTERKRQERQQRQQRNERYYGQVNGKSLVWADGASGPERRNIQGNRAAVPGAIGRGFGGGFKTGTVPLPSLKVFPQRGGESIKLLASVIASGRRQFWVGGNFEAVNILETPQTDVVMDAFITNTGILQIDWIAGIKTRTPSANPATTPDVIKIYTIYGDGRSTQIYSGVEARYLKYVGDGFWTSEPVEPDYDVYSQPIPADPPIEDQTFQLSWEGFRNIAYEVNASGTSSVLLTFNPVTLTWSGTPTDVYNLFYFYTYFARDGAGVAWPNPPLSFSYQPSAVTISGFESVPGSFQFSGTNSRVRTIQASASYGGFWGTGSGYTQNSLALPVTKPTFTAYNLQRSDITQATQYPTWNYYNGQLTYNAGTTDVSVASKWERNINSPSYSYANAYQSNTLFSQAFFNGYDDVTRANGFPGYALTPGRVRTINTQDLGHRNYSGVVYLSPSRTKAVFRNQDINSLVTDKLVDSLQTVNSVEYVLKTPTLTTANNTKTHLLFIELSHYINNTTVGVEQTLDTRTNANALSNYNRTVYYGSTQLIANLNGTLDPSWEYAFGYYHAAQWIDQSKYFWIEMPADMGTGIDDARHWDEVEFPDHADFATEVLDLGRTWNAIEYAANASNAYLPVGSASAISSFGFGLGAYTEPRIYDARYVRV